MLINDEKLVLLGHLELPGAEITAYDASTSTAYVIGGDDKLYVVDISNPTNPELKETLTLAGNAQSVAVNSDGLIAVAVDREATVDGSTATYHADGLVQFFTTVDGVIEAAGQVTVGSLPDSLAFNEDGTIIVTANEGEPNMFYGMGEDSMDPEGSISVIEVNAVEPSASTVTTLGFDAYNDFLVQLLNKGVRISGDDAADGIEGNLVAQDIEPEYVTITGDKAYVSLQENNAIAVVDLVAKEITDIFPVGLKDWSRGIPEATEYAFSITYPGDRPDADGDGVVDDGEVVAGGLSGLWYDGVEEVDGVEYEIYYTITDRGPQAFNIGDREGDNPEDPALGEKVFEDPYYPITIYKLGKDSDGNVVELDSTTLQVPDASGEGFRDATGLGMLDRNDAAYAPVEKIAEHYFLTPIDGKIPATDSASAITAIITGEKTDAGNISWASGDADGGELETIAETLRDDLGFAIGVASTVPFSHATPAGVVSHDVNRGNKWDIAHEILFDTAPDVVIGGGYENSYFATTTTNAAGEDKDLDDNGYNDDYDAFVNGTDGTDYVFVERAEGVDGGQALLDAAATVDLSAGDKLFGLFGTSDGNFEYFDVADQPGDPEVTRDIEDPTLADITTATLSVLNQDEDGFFVMFEQGDIDWSNHANDYENMIGGVYDLDQAVLTAEAYVDAGKDGISWENTLVIVTSDHSNSYLRSEEVLGLGNLPTQEGTPYSFTYPDGEVTYSTTGHTNELVTVAARGAGAELFEEYAGLWYDGANIVDNTQIYDVMKAAVEEAGVEHIMLFIGDGMNIEHEVAASRYLYGEDQALAWDSWGSIEEGWSGYATTWDIDTYNLYASAAGEEAYDAENFDPVIGYDPALGGTTPYPVASDDPAVQEFLDENSYALLGKDQFGLDAEAVLRLEIDGLNDGNAVFAVADEYGPQIAIFDAATGELIHRMVPENTEFEAATNITYADNPDYTLETLPEVYSSITNNRGFEAMAYNSDDGLLYAFIQSPLRPDGYLNTEVTRIVAVNPVTGEAVHEYLYSLTGEPGQDKIGDAVYDTARGVFYVIERDSATTSDANKSVFEINLAGATDVLEYTTGANGKSWEDLLGDGVDQPELSDAASLADALAGEVQFVYKNELLNIPSLGIDPSFDKAEGLALKEDGTLVVTFDNDFVHDEDRDTDNMLVEITFNDLLVDTSDNEGGEEDVINPDIRDFYGMRMPDGIDSYEYNGDTFIVMANEGDGRVRPDSVNFEVDDEYDGAWLKLVSELEGGEDVVDTITDPLTGEEIHIIVSDESDDDAKEVEAGDEFFLTMKYGWASDDDFYTDETRLYKYDDDNDTLSDEEEDKESDIGRLKTVNTEVYLTEDAADAESPDQIIAFGGRSISIMDSNGNIVYDSGDLIEQAAIAAGVYDDGRSDDKGTEPESIALANVNGKTIAYVALERVNSLAVFDVTNPYNVSFIELVDIAADTGLEAPEGLVADDGLLIVSNEETTGLAVYGTVSSAYNSGDDNESYVMYREQGNIYMGDKVKANHITGGSLNDSITGGSGNDSLYGGDGDDYIYAESGDDYVEAGAGDDIIVGGNGEGDDTYDGGAGSDTVIYTSAEDDITVDLALGFATSTNGEDAANIGNDILIDIQNILAGDYDDTLIGNDDDNRIEAGKGDDTITGGGGNDSIIGGEGIDTVLFSGEREEYAISYDEQIDTFTIIHKEDGADGTDTLTGIENLSFVDEMALNAEDFTSSILDAAQASSSGSSDDSSAILIGLGVVGFFALVL